MYTSEEISQASQFYRLLYNKKNFYDLPHKKQLMFLDSVSQFKTIIKGE